jgi:hypothetical protein
MILKLTLTAATVALAAALAGQCGIVPIKPIVPIGRKDLKPQCQCDEKGQNCKYIWVCVPNK